MRRRHHSQVDEASLQTDVMRFMAIVAFCLIAILAMVRNVESPVAEVEPEATAAREPDVPETPAELMPLPRLPAPEPLPQPPQEIAEPEERVFVFRPALPEPEEQPVPPVSEPEVLPPPAPAPASTPQVTAAAPRDEKAVPQAEAPAIPAEPAQQEEGLTLRFASEADFLRLVARGKVAVYAFDETRFLSLAPDYRFAPVTPPQQVYELDPGTIPRQMRSALTRVDGPVPTKGAVGLPPRVQRQIRELVDNVHSGELLINRFEEVRHVAAR